MKVNKIVCKFKQKIKNFLRKFIEKAYDNSDCILNYFPRKFLGNPWIREKYFREVGKSILGKPSMPITSFTSRSIEFLTFSDDLRNLHSQYRVYVSRGGVLTPTKRVGFHPKEFSSPFLVH